MNAIRLTGLRIAILAAGHSTRLGRPKALATVHGRGLLIRTARVLAPFAVRSPIIVLVPPNATRYRVGLPARGFAFVANRRRAAGLSASVRLAVAEARFGAAVLLLPVDLAGLDGRDIARLVRRWCGARRSVAARRIDAAHGGAPLILPHGMYARVKGLEGDLGLRDILRRLPAATVRLVDMPSCAPDVDSAQDLRRARRRIRPGRTNSGGPKLSGP